LIAPWRTSGLKLQACHQRRKGLVSHEFPKRHCFFLRSVTPSTFRSRQPATNDRIRSGLVVCPYPSVLAEILAEPTVADCGFVPAPYNCTVAKCNRVRRLRSFPDKRPLVRWKCVGNVGRRPFGQGQSRLMGTLR
jgi:hypothetical protein